MNFHDTPEEAAFRQEIRTFVKNEAPKAGSDPFAFGFQGHREWTKKLAARNWIAPAWPKEYGGAGLSVMEQFIFNSELAEARTAAGRHRDRLCGPNAHRPWHRGAEGEVPPRDPGRGDHLVPGL
jgi:alkylation response protein AidB-like acyl-CoA dehydrogenase